VSIDSTIKVKPSGFLQAVRAAMAGTESVQERLDNFVDAIVGSMQVDLASIYLELPGGEMELSATRGLKKSAVHKTLMERNEGLVGYVAHTARPLNLANASAHPLFSHRPETGEEKYNSFLGVPILRGGRTLGVLVVQNEKARTLDEEEVEDFLTVAMVLAEIIIDDERAGGSAAAIKGIALNPVKPETIRGKAFSDGLVAGMAHLHVPPVAPADLLSDDTAAEELRLEEAVAGLRISVDAMVRGEAADLSRASREIYETYRMFAYDQKWVQRLREAVHSGLTSEAAVERVRNEHRARLMKAHDPYLRARLHDLEDLANRLLRVLSGETLGPGNKQVADNTVIFARDLGPAELLDYDYDKIAGIVLEEGAMSSHTTIICHAIGVPLIGRAEGILDHIENGDPVLLDGETGEVHIRPIESHLARFNLRMNIRGEMAKAYDANRGRPAVTRDGRHISMHLNAGLVMDLPQLDRSGAEGIGLFRTEFQFMITRHMPRLDEQTALYKKALETVGKRPVTFRTLDLGGDKILPYMDPVLEENPAIGWRAIRIALDRPGLLRYQLRALIAAAAGNHLRVMFPMVTTVDEFIECRALFSKEMKRATQLGQNLPHRVEVGVMMETPSLAWSVRAICDHVDFVSVGANDLMQFFFAADRDNVRVADRYDPLHPASLSILRFIADGCHGENVPVSICGEIAGRPLEAICLVALGFDTLSMPVIGIGPVKSALLALDAGKLRTLIEPLIHTDSQVSTIRGHVREFCMREGIPV